MLLQIPLLINYLQYYLFRKYSVNSTYFGFYAENGSSTSTATNAHGYYVRNTFTDSATNVYGFLSNVNVGIR